MDEHLGWLDRPYDDFCAMEFAAAGALVARLSARHGVAPRGLDLGAIEARLAAEARRRATDFDTRNGTDHQSRRTERWLGQEPIADAVALPPDDPVPDTAAAAALAPEGRQEMIVPLSTEAIAAILDERGDRYMVDDDGSVAGRWGDAVIHFDRTGPRKELLHIRALADVRFPRSRRTELYEFCNGWNHDRLLPKAYVHDTGAELVIAGETTTDLEHGIAATQLAVIIQTAISASAALADALGRLPGPTAASG